GDGCAVALDLERAVDRHVVAFARDRSGLEVELGVRRRLEEVGRLEVLGQLVVVDVDARRLRRAPEARLVEARLEGGERAPERRDAPVDDSAGGPGMGRVERPGATRNHYCVDGAAHVLPPCRWRITCAEN